MTYRDRRCDFQERESMWEFFMILPTALEKCKQILLMTQQNLCSHISDLQ